MLRGLAAQVLDRGKQYVVIAGTQKNASILERRFHNMYPDGVTSSVSFKGAPGNQYAAARDVVFVWDNYPLELLMASWIALDNARTFIQSRYEATQHLYYQAREQNRKDEISIEKITLENERLSLHSGNDVY